MRHSLRTAWSFCLAAIATCVSAPLVARAAGESVAVTLRAGTAQEAAQQTLKGGPEVEFLVDRRTGGPVDFGLGLGFARDPGGGTYSRDRVNVTSVGAHARSSLRHRAHLELGLGYYWIDRESTASGEPAGSSQHGAGGFAGGGYEVWRGPEVGIGLALAYHLIAAEAALEGGNVEDFYTLALTVRWGGVAPR